MKSFAEFAGRRLLASLVFVVALAGGNQVGFAQDGQPVPAYNPLRSPVRIAFAPDGSVLVSDHRLQKILTLDKNTLELRDEFSVAGSPSGLASGNGLYYVGNETAERVEAYNPNGEKQYNLGGDYAIQQPNDISVDTRSGQVFVVDTQGRCVRVFARNGAYVRSIPAANLEPNLLANPTGIALDENNQEVLVSDFGAPEANIGARIQVFTYDGKYAGTIAGISTKDGDRFHRPQGLAADGHGRVFLVDSLSSMVLVFDRETGEQVKTFGEYGTDPGQLALPLDIVIDSASKDALVTSNRTQRIEIFKRAAEQAAAEGEGEGEGEDPQPNPFSCAGISAVGPSQGNAGDLAVLALVAAVILGCSLRRSVRAARWMRRLGAGRVLVIAAAAVTCWGSSAAYAQGSVHECTYCHGVWEPGGQTLLHNPSVEILCLTCHGPGGISVLKADVHTNHAGSSRTFRKTCTDCHETYMNQTNWHGGTNIKLVLPEIETSGIGLRNVAFESRGYDAGGATLHSFADNDEDGDGIYDGVCEVCHTQTANHRNDSTGNHDHSTGANCTSCHSHIGFFQAAACDSCHGAPPATGAHLKHFGGDAGLASYGGTQDLSTATDYTFQCGSCHPMLAANHRNGVVDIELYNASAPAGSLKSKTRPTHPTFRDRPRLPTRTGSTTRSGRVLMSIATARPIGRPRIPSPTR